MHWRGALLERGFIGERAYRGGDIFKKVVERECFEGAIGE